MHCIYRKKFDALIIRKKKTNKNQIRIKNQHPSLYICSAWPIPAGHGAEASAHRLYATPNPRTGKGIPFQAVPDTKTANRNRSHANAVRATN